MPSHKNDSEIGMMLHSALQQSPLEEELEEEDDELEEEELSGQLSPSKTMGPHSH